jgi:hypothetical protein
MVGDKTARVARELPPRAFAFVMATGIISVGAFRLGPSWLSRVLLVFACGGLGFLAIALVVRCWRYPAFVVADWRSHPSAAHLRHFGVELRLPSRDVLRRQGTLRRGSTSRVHAADREGALWVAVAAWVVVMAAGAVAAVRDWRPVDGVVAAVDVTGTASDHSV